MCVNSAQTRHSLPGNTADPASFSALSAFSGSYHFGGSRTRPVYSHLTKCIIYETLSHIAMQRSEWTRFPGRQHNRFVSTTARVTMDPSGVIYMNEAAWVALDRPKSVELMFDKRRRAIGIVKCTPAFESGFEVKDKKGTRGKYTRASAFCMHFSIRMARTALFNDIVLDEKGMMILYLDTVTAITRGAR